MMSDPSPVVRALVLAGGLGSRLRPLTEATPKCLVEIGGLPLLAHWVLRLEHGGVTEVVVNTHHLRQRVLEFIERVNARGRIRMRESFEPELLGSAGTISATRDLAAGASCVLVVYADNLSDVDLGAFARFHASHALPMSIALFRAEHPRACGIATLDAHGTMVAFEEKPRHPTSDLANAGLYAFDPEAYVEVADLGAFDIGFDVLPRFVGRARGFELVGYHRDIGTLESLERAREDVACGRLEPPEGDL